MLNKICGDKDRQLFEQEQEGRLHLLTGGCRGLYVEHALHHRGAPVRLPGKVAALGSSRA